MLPLPLLKRILKSRKTQYNFTRLNFSEFNNLNKSYFPTLVNEYHSYFVENGPSTMTAAILPGVGQPLQTELLQIPRPKAGEVLLKTRACGVCHTDLHVMKGETVFPTPCVLGHEVTGEILEHGKHTDSATINRLPIGTNVVGSFIMPCGGCYYCIQGSEDLCETFFEYNRLKGTLYDGTTRLFKASDSSPIAMYSMGGLAQYCVLPSTAISPLPPSLPFSESSIMGCAFFTAYGAIRNGADLRAGQTLAIIGMGGVGSSCLQVAKAFGCGSIIAVDVHDSKLKKAIDFGADHVINASLENVTSKIRELTNGRGVDVAIEALGKPITFDQTVQAVRDGGRAVMVGIAPAGVSAQVDITRLVRRKISIVGSYGAKARVDLPSLISLADSGKIDLKSMVSKYFRLEDAKEAYASLDRGEIIGRSIIDMNI